MPLNVIVVGAGIAGLASAIALQRAGHRVTVVEQAADTPPGGALSVWPDALAALDHLGLGGAVRSAGHPVQSGSVRDAEGRWLHRFSADVFLRSLGEPMVVIERARLREVLMGALDSASVHFGLPVRGAIDCERHVRVQWEGGESSADLVVGADGLGSVIAVRLCGPLDRRYSGTVAWSGIAEVGVPAGFAGDVVGPGASFGIAPMGRERTHWSATGKLPAGVVPAAGVAAHLAGRFSSWPEPIAELLAATPAGRIGQTAIDDRDVAPRWTRGRVVLVGDAAHPIRPRLGRGGCQAIEDAVILAGAVGDGSNVQGALAEYADVRRRRTRWIVGESRAVEKLLDTRSAGLSRLLDVSRIVPDRVLMRHFATVAAYDAFRPFR